MSLNDERLDRRLKQQMVTRGYPAIHKWEQRRRLAEADAPPLVLDHFIRTSWMEGKPVTLCSCGRGHGEWGPVP